MGKTCTSRPKTAINNAETDDQVAALQRLDVLPLERATVASLNVRDTILHDNINDGIPSQYVNEPADCRLYFTAAMHSDVTEVWKAAANSAFNGAKCAAGGIARPAKREAKPATKPRHIEPLSAEKRAELRSFKVPDSKAWRAVHQMKAIQ